MGGAGETSPGSVLSSWSSLSPTLVLLSVGPGGPGSGLRALQQLQQGLRDAQEVDHLRNTEQRGDDQGAAVGPLQEGRGTLIPQYLPVEKQGSELVLPPLHPTSEGPRPPGAVQEPRVGVFVDPALQRLEPCLHNCREA